MRSSGCTQNTKKLQLSGFVLCSLTSCSCGNRRLQVHSPEKPEAPFFSSWSEELWTFVFSWRSLSFTPTHGDSWRRRRWGRAHGFRCITNQQEPVCGLAGGFRLKRLSKFPLVSSQTTDKLLFFTKLLPNIVAKMQLCCPHGQRAALKQQFPVFVLSWKSGSSCLWWCYRETFYGCARNKDY